jgi:formate hydrogenlyase subunit 3/multisubunit Na+/H+ antiporter MnhD subunit
MIFEYLPSLPLSPAVFRNLWILLPLLPIAGILLILIAHYGLQRDRTAGIFLATIIGQLALGGTILRGAGALGPGPHDFAVSLWDHAIVFRAEPVKLLHLGILMVPLALAMPGYARIRTPYLRIIFLFFLSGCSGVVVTGDMFNLFVFYELMIMAAYVLVATRQNFAEAIKYMMFGSISSIAFLGGIIVLYAGGAPFSMQVETFAAVPPTNAWWAMVLFTLAFGVKSAFFPIALAPCHAAAGSLFSPFLASFTIFTGMIGLHYFVLLPAAMLEMTAFSSLIGTLSILTIVTSALILFWEPEYHRAVAQSTILSVGITGLLLSQGAGEYAFVYVLVHALYKSLLFMLGEDLQQTAREIRVSSPLTLCVIAAGVFLASGTTPGLQAHFKEAAEAGTTWIQPVLLFAAFGTLGGFRKFRYTVQQQDKPTTPWRSVTLYAMSAALACAAYLQLGLPAFWNSRTLLDLAILVLSLCVARPLYQALPRLVSLDRHWIYGSLNRQLLYIILLFCFILLWLYPTAPTT